MIFGVLNPIKFDINSLYTVAALPWEIQKSHFQEYYSYILQIIYVISEENKLLPPYLPQLKDVTALPCKMQNFFDLAEGNVAFLRTLVALRRTGCDVWQLECQASNVTASVQSDYLLHGYMLQSFSPLINCIVHHALLKFSPCCNKTLPQLVRIADWYSIQALLQHVPDVAIYRVEVRTGGLPQGLMNWGVSRRRSSTVSRARCAGALSCWKTSTSPAMLGITASSFCVSNKSR